MLRLLFGLSAVVTWLASFLGYSPPPAAPFGQRTGRPAIVAIQPTQVAIGVLEDSALLGVDDFARSAEDSWPAATKGGDYTLFGPTVDFGVGSGAGLIRTPSGAVRGVALLGVIARDVDLRTRIVTDRPADGGDQFVYLVIRRVDDENNYLGRLRFDSAHTAWLQAGRTAHGSTEMLGDETRVPGYAHGASSALWLRAAAVGETPTAVRLKAWPDGQAEPDSWQYSVTDSDASVWSAGAVALQTYVSARATNAPVTFRFSDFRVSAAAPELIVTPPGAPVAAPTPRLATLASAPTPAVAPTVARPTLAPTPVPPTSAQVWEALQPDLDAVWGTDTQRTIALLDGFIGRFPDHPVAREKLFAALLARADDLVSAGDPEQAVEPLQRAEALFPARGEVAAALASLTPTPAEAQQTDAQEVEPAVAPAQTGASAAVAVRPAPARPAPPPPVVVRAPAPTPTKAPFIAPPRPSS
jgi:hypothetical protein